MIARCGYCLFAASLFTVLFAAARGAPLVSFLPQGSGYAYRRTIAIDHTKVPNTDQSNFPLLISGAYSYLATTANGGNVQNPNGYDVIFTSDAGCATKLDHQVETYTSTTGAVNYWVRVPSLSHTTDTTIYLCYGNSAITTDQSNETGVWDSNFKAVYHLSDQAANTTVADSTANGSNGINAANTSGKSVSGKLGNGFSYNGSTDYTTIGVTQTTSFTWECWFKLTDWTTQAGSSNYSTLMAANWNVGGQLLMLWKDNGWLVQFSTDNPVNGLASAVNSVAPGSWHHAAYTRTGNAVIFLPNFSNPAEQNWTDTVGTIAELMHLAGQNDLYSDYELAMAVKDIPEYAAMYNGNAKSNPFDPAYTGDAKDKDSGGYSTFFHTVQRNICEVPKED